MHDETVIEGRIRRNDYRVRTDSALLSARSLDYIGSERSILIEWLRLPGDLVFILFGAVPLAIAAIKGYAGVRAKVKFERMTATTE